MTPRQPMSPLSLQDEQQPLKCNVDATRWEARRQRGMGAVCPFPENVRSFIYFCFISLRQTPQQTWSLGCNKTTTSTYDNPHHHDRVTTRCTQNATQLPWRNIECGKWVPSCLFVIFFVPNISITLLMLLQKTSSPVDATENNKNTMTTYTSSRCDSEATTHEHRNDIERGMDTMAHIARKGSFYQC